MGKRECLNSLKKHDWIPNYCIYIAYLLHLDASGNDADFDKLPAHIHEDYLKNFHPKICPYKSLYFLRAINTRHFVRFSNGIGFSHAKTHQFNVKVVESWTTATFKSR